MEKNENLFKFTTLLLEEAHPELKETLEGLAPFYAKIIFVNRIKRGLSQQELAIKANVELITITRAEGGFDKLSSETYNKIFRSLNLRSIDIEKAIAEL